VYFEFEVTVPADTPKDRPHIQDLELKPGVINRMAVEFPMGCRGMVHCQIWHIDVPLWPTNPEGSIAADGVEVRWAEHTVKLEKPWILRVKAWSPGTRYSHTLRVRINLLPLPGLYPWL